MLQTYTIYTYCNNIVNVLILQGDITLALVVKAAFDLKIDTLVMYKKCRELTLGTLYLMVIHLKVGNGSGVA